MCAVRGTKLYGLRIKKDSQSKNKYQKNIFNSFDLILNMFTSFGYFTEIDNLKTIFAFKKSLNPSGSLIIDFMNLGFVTKNFIKKEVILKKGIKEQDSEQKILEIVKPVKFSCDYGYAELVPNSPKDEGLNINLESSFEGKYEDQDIKIKNLNGNYIESISKARTFGFFQEIEYLKSQNLIKGGSLDNAIVIKDKKPLNKDGLRYDNELMRHKVLDVVGDLYLSGYPIIGTYKGFKTGHFITNNLLKELFKSKENYRIHKIN